MFSRQEIELAECFSLDSKFVKFGMLPRHMGNANEVCLGALARNYNRLERKSKKSDDKLEKASRIEKYRQQVANVQEIEFDVNDSLFYRNAVKFLDGFEKMSDNE